MMEVETREPGTPAEAGSNEAILQEIREALDEAFEFEESDREWAERDLKILGGDTWRQEDRQDRESDRRPCLSFPVLAQYVDQCLGDWRQNRADIVVRPAAGSSESTKYQTKDGKEIDAHEAWAGIIRAIHSESRADIAHDTALEHAVSNAFGHYRIITEYADDGFNQVIRVKRIQDQFSVFWDPAATEYDKSDARYCLIAQHIPVRRFESEYPGKATSMDLPVPENMTPWYDSKGETVRVVEYFKREPVTKNRMLLSNGAIVTEEDMKPGELDALLKSGVTVAKERKVTDYKVTWYKASGVDVLEGPQDWAGKFIPVVSVWGKEEPTGNGQIRHRSLIRHAHDAARVHDWMRTAGVEAMALQPKAPFVVGQSQLGSHAHLWQTANTKNHAFLPYDDTENKSPPQRQQPGFPGAGFFNEANTAREDIKAAVGIYDAALGAKSNETSGKAIIARQRESDTMSFAYIDNLARSMTYEARILLDLAPKIYDTPQEMTMLMVDGAEAVLELYKPAMDEMGQPIMGPDGKPVLLNDLSAGTYQCNIDTGPSYMTKRAESAESMLEFVRALPAAGAVAGDLIAKNLDWPGADQFAKRLKYLLPPEVRQAEDAEANGGQALPPEVQMQLDQAQQAMAAMQEQLQQMQPMLEQSQQALDAAQAKLEAANQKSALERQKWSLELDRAQFTAEQQLAKAQAMFDDRLKQMEDVVDQTKRALEDQHTQRVAKVDAERESEKQTAAERQRGEQEGGLKRLIESLQAFQEEMADKYEAIAKATAAPRDVKLKYDDKGDITDAVVTPRVGKTEEDND